MPIEVVGGKASLSTYQSNPALNRCVLDGKLDEVRLSLRAKTKQEIGESMCGEQGNYILNLAFAKRYS